MRSPPWAPDGSSDYDPHTSTRPSCTCTVLSGEPHIAHLGYCCSAPPQALPSLAQLLIQLLSGDQFRRCHVWRLSSFLDMQAVLLALHPAVLLWVLCTCHAVRCHSVKIRPLGFVRDDVLFEISPESFLFLIIRRPDKQDSTRQSKAPRRDTRVEISCIARIELLTWDVRWDFSYLI